MKSFSEGIYRTELPHYWNIVNFLTIAHEETKRVRANMILKGISKNKRSLKHGNLHGIVGLGNSYFKSRFLPRTIYLLEFIT